MMKGRNYVHFFFFNDTATTEIYTLSLHDALPIFPHFGLSHKHIRNDFGQRTVVANAAGQEEIDVVFDALIHEDRKSTRLNSSHANISYAVFCLKKKIPNATLISPS